MLTNRSRQSLVGIAVVVALVAVGTALATFSSPKLQLLQLGATTTIAASAASTDDSTAFVAIYVPAGTSITSSQAAGTELGTVKAQVSALALGGALLPLEGPIVVAPPGAVPPASQTACIQDQTPLSTWLLRLSAAGQTINLPAYLIQTGGTDATFGVAKLVFCLAPPDLPVDKGGATFGAKLLSATRKVNGVFGPATAGPWLAAWIPWVAGAGTLDTSQFSWTPAQIAPGAVTVKAKTLGKGAVVTGTVRQAGAGRAGATVTVFSGLKRGSLRKVATVRTKANGTFSVRAKTGAFFRASAVATEGAAPQLCTALIQKLPNARCLNPNVSGFTATSGVVARRK